MHSKITLNTVARRRRRCGETWPAAPYVDGSLKGLRVDGSPAGAEPRPHPIVEDAVEVQQRDVVPKRPRAYDSFRSSGWTGLQVHD